MQRCIAVGGKLRGPLGRTGLFIIREIARLLRARKSTWGPSTGKLAKSFTMLLDEMSVVIGSRLPYARIQHFGWVVRPKGHKYLAIPVLPHLRRSGAWPRDLGRDSMRFVPNARIRIGSHSWVGPALVRAADTDVTGSFEGAGIQGRDSRGQFTDDVSKQKRAVRAAGEVMFALVKKVTIRGQPYLMFSAAARAFALTQVAREFTRAWSGRR